tara:strand:+ start:174 stop:479 length:306 start_codon:yes stop_codon:yes gene_type:complete
MEFQRIDINTAIPRIDKDDFIVVDIRDRESFLLGHINGSINLSNRNMNNFILNTQKEKSILVCCYHGNSSQSVAKFLVSSGFNDVYSLDGGYEAWKNKKDK